MDHAGLLTVGGGRLEYARLGGANPPILLLHEALGSVSVWRNFPAALARATGHAVITVSRHGHGASDPPPLPRAPDYLDREADLLPAVMDALGVPRAHLLGHSDGASIALLVAARHPGWVDRLMLLAPHVNVEEKAIAAIEDARRAYATTDLRVRLARHHRDPDHVFRSWHDVWLSPAFRGWSIETALAAIFAPTLIIQGRDDAYFSMDQMGIVARHVAGATCLALERCGHSPHRECPAIVLDAVRRFLSAPWEAAALSAARRSPHRPS